MSNREKVIELLNTLPEHKVDYVLAYLQGMTDDEEADEAFCTRLYASYQTQTDKGEVISLEEAAKQLGVSLS